MSQEEVEYILSSEYHGVLSSYSENGFPMSVPICYIYHNNAIYFHSANSGEKYDNIEKDLRVSFLVWRKKEAVTNPKLGKYESVLIYGNAIRMLPNEPEAKDALIKMSLHFDLPRKAHDEYIEAGTPHSVAYRIDIIHISGKSQIVF